MKIPFVNKKKDLEKDFEPPPLPPDLASTSNTDPVTQPMPGTPQFNNQPGEVTQPPVSQYEPPNMQPQVMTPADSGNAKEDDNLHMQIVIAKLEAIQNKLESISHRIDKLEQRPAQEQAKKGPWYGSR